MADADEDVIHMELAADGDNDHNEETQDYRFLQQMVDAADAKIPKRGEKDFEEHPTALQKNTLDASRQAMHGALSVGRTHVPRNHVIAIYDPKSNMAYVDRQRGTHLQTMGYAQGSRLWLYPEEALYMLERGSLDVRWPHSADAEDSQTENEDDADDLPMSLQGAYAAFIGIESASGRRLTLEEYTVYSGLKRNGYTVRRADSFDGKMNLYHARGSAIADLGADTPPSWSLQTLNDLWRRLFDLNPKHSSTALSLGPLVTPGLYRSYVEIYKLLQIIPYHDPRATPTFSTTATSTTQDAPHPYHISYNVWKPSTPYTKRNPPPPDFRICVINARETSMPTVQELNDLLVTTPYDPPRPDAHLYGKLKQGYRNVILAVVDQGIPSYLRVSEAGFAFEKLYERKPAGGGKKGGQNRKKGKGGKKSAAPSGGGTAS